MREGRFGRSARPGIGARPTGLLTEVVLLLCFLAVWNVQAAPAPEYLRRADAALAKGQELLYNSEYAAAEEQFALCAAIDESSAICPWRMAYARFSALWHGKDDNRLKLEKKEYEDTVNLINTAIDKAGKKIDAGEDADFYLYVQSTLFNLRGALEFANGRGWDARSSWETAYRKAKSSKSKEAGYVIGFMAYKLSEQGWAVRTFASLAGYPTDRKEGLKLIGEAAKDNGSKFADDVWFAIFLLAKDEKNRDYYGDGYVEKVFLYLSRKYPKNDDLGDYLSRKPAPEEWNKKIGGAAGAHATNRPFSQNLCPIPRRGVGRFVHRWRTLDRADYGL